MIALDASALLALLFREQGAEQVATHLSASCLSAVNLAEVIGRFVRDGHDADDVLARLSASEIELVPFTPEQAAIAAKLIPKTSRLGLSLGDRACLALALFRSIPALTADRNWKRLKLGVSIAVIR
ncbi:MAG: type II toxin-antitoxin system VapC family toxin [Gammaproteobacteria bacterium]